MSQNAVTQAAVPDLTQLRARLSDLVDAPVATHPDVLEGVHRALVAALDGLAATGGERAAR